MNINQLLLNHVCIPKASVIKPFFSPCASHVLYLIIYFTSRFYALTSILIRYKIKLDSDDERYGGHGRLDHNTEFFTEPNPFNGRPNSMQVNISLFFFFFRNLMRQHPKHEGHFTFVSGVFIVKSHPHQSTFHPTSNMIARLHSQSPRVKRSQKCHHAY